MIRVVHPLHELPMLTFFLIYVSLCLSCSIFVPVDVVKERLQVQSNRLESTYKGSIDAFRTIVKQEGARGLYKGYTATLFSYGPFSAMYFLLYEEVRSVCLLQLSWCRTFPAHQLQVFCRYYCIVNEFLSLLLSYFRPRRKWQGTTPLLNSPSSRTCYGECISCAYFGRCLSRVPYVCLQDELRAVARVNILLNFD